MLINTKYSFDYDMFSFNVLYHMIDSKELDRMMEKLKEKMKRYYAGLNKYRLMWLIPGTTSYRDIDHEDDVTTSCVQCMTETSSDDVICAGGNDNGNEDGEGKNKGTMGM